MSFASIFSKYKKLAFLVCGHCMSWREFFFPLIFFLNEIKSAYEFLSWIMPVVLNVKKKMLQTESFSISYCYLIEVLWFYLLKLRSVVHLFFLFFFVDYVKNLPRSVCCSVTTSWRDCLFTLGNFCSCVKEQLTGFEQLFFWALGCFINKCVSSFISATLSCEV